MPISLKQYGGQKIMNSANIASTVFKYKCQLHIYHWQTKIFSRHSGADVLLESLDDFLDKFIEAYMGKYGRPNFAAGTSIPLSNMDDNQAVTYLDEMVNYFTNEIVNYIDEKKDTDLLNIRDEVLAGINKVKYLFTLG
jgi:hypothetical protein